MDPISNPEQFIGSLIADRYHLDALIGRGGMGAVYLAEDRNQGREVALKFLLPAPGQEAVRALRFMREARLASSLKHPHVIDVFDFGITGPQRSQRFLAMELVRGVSLSSLIEFGVLDPPCAAGLLLQVLEALSYVHARGILHRDIKPDNILVTRAADGLLRARLTDFGLATLMQDDSSRLTDENTLVGTPEFMAPEQVDRGILHGPEVDLYAVGVMLYQLWVQRPLFTGSLLQMLFQKVNQDPEIPPRPAPDIDAACWPVLRRLLARDPALRFRMAPDVRADLEPLATPPRLDEDAWLALSQGERWMDGASRRTQPLEASSARHLSQRHLWGRETELAALDDIARDVELGQGRLIVLTGEIGVGKSALMETLGIHLREAGRFLSLRATLEPRGGLTPLRHAIERWLGVTSSPREDVERAIREFYLRYDPDNTEDIIELLRFLRPDVDAQTPQSASPARSFALLLRWLRGLASDRPVLLELDDLQLGGEHALAFLDFLQFELACEPCALLVLSAAQTSDALNAEPFQQQLDRLERTAVIQKYPLTPLASADLCAWLRHKHGVSEREATRLAEYTAGNPLLAMLLLDNIAEAQTQVFTSDSTGSTPLPERLRDLLRQQLDGILATFDDRDELRGLLVSLALLGGRARVSLLEHMMSWDEDRLDERLDLLIEAQLLKEFPNLDEVAFVHPPIRDVLLTGRSRRSLKRLHRAAADALIECAIGDADAAATAAHLEAANEPQQAHHWWRRAMRFEQTAGQARVAADHGIKALELMASDPDDRAQRQALALHVGQLLREIGDLQAALDLLLPLVSTDTDSAMLAGEMITDIYQEQVNKPARAALIADLEPRLDEASPAGRRAFWRAKARWFTQTGRQKEAIHTALRALENAPPGHETHLAAVRLAWAYMFLNDSAQASEMTRLALDHAENDPLREAEAHRVQFFVDYRSGDARHSSQTITRQIEIYRRAGLTAKVVRAMTDRVSVIGAQGEYERCFKAGEEVRRLANRLGMRAEAERGYFTGATYGVWSDQVERTIDALTDLLHSSAAFINIEQLGKTALALARLRMGEPSVALDLLESLQEINTPFTPPLFAELTHDVARRLGELSDPELQPRILPQQRRLYEAALVRRERLGQEEKAEQCRVALQQLAANEDPG